MGSFSLQTFMNSFFFFFLNLGYAKVFLFKKNLGVARNNERGGVRLGHLLVLGFISY